MTEGDLFMKPYLREAVIKIIFTYKCIIASYIINIVYLQIFQNNLLKNGLIYVKAKINKKVNIITLNISLKP